MEGEGKIPQNHEVCRNQYYTKSEEADDSKTVFSDLIFTVAANPYQVQLQSTLATLDIQEDNTIKFIFSVAGAWMQVQATTTTSNTYTVNLLIPKFQVAMMAKKGDTIIDQGGNSYSMNVLMLSGFIYLDHIISKPTSNGETNSPYLLQPSLSPYQDKEGITSRELSSSPISSGKLEKGGDTNNPSE